MLQLQLVCCAWRPPASHRPLLRPSRRGGRARPPALGVPGFSTWMDVQFASSRSRVPEGFSADVVAFDLNSLLHNQLRRAADEPHAIKLTFQKLHATLRCVRPESTVLLAIDGVPWLISATNAPAAVNIRPTERAAVIQPEDALAAE